jgi:sodium transport system ATP-binding protein
MQNVQALLRMMPMIEVEALSKAFVVRAQRFGKRARKAVLSDICLRIEDNRIVGLLGENGAGKTTLLRILATLLKPDRGKARVGGTDLVAGAEEVRRKIGFVAANMGLYERLSGRENLMLFGRLHGLSDADSKARIENLSELLRMHDFVEQSAGGYSTGMRQKVAVARAVLHEPPLLMLDEATNGLDVRSRRACSISRRVIENQVDWWCSQPMC